MTTIAVVQARMGSTRLPGKVLMDLGGRPALQLQLERLEPLRSSGAVADVVVATSDLAIDDPVAELGQRLALPVVRGSEGDVLERFCQVLDQFPADRVVRLTGDCPLSDPAVVTEGLARHRLEAADYTSNTLVRTFPDGLDVEIVQAEALRAAAAEASAPAEREHVTPFVYRRPERFRLAAWTIDPALGDLRWTLDTADDLTWLRATVARLDHPVEAPWTVVAEVADHRSTARGPQRLEVLGATDPAWVDDLARRPRPWILGPDVPPEPPPSNSQPAERAWVLTDAGVAIGWVAVRVVSGMGTVRGVAPPDQHGRLRTLLDQALAADAQVERLVGREPGDEDG